MVIDIVQQDMNKAGTHARKKAEAEHEVKINTLYCSELA